jgi:hypothetical protein
MLRVATATGFSTAPIGFGDLRDCIDIRPAQSGSDHLGLPRALEQWKTLISMGDQCGHMMVRRDVGRLRELVAVAIAVFVKTEFADRELAHPEPGLNARLLESLAHGRSMIADYEYIARANAAGRLNQVIMYCTTRRDLLSADEDTVVRGMLTHGYGQLFAGYRLARMLTEVVDPQDLEALASYPSIKVASRFDGSERVLCVATGATFSADPSSVAVPIFTGQAIPRFGLSRGEKEMLKEALTGMDDAEMAMSLKRTPAALKRRWNQIFQKVARVEPDLCPDAVGGVRGPQKRHRILGYLRNHPEELRPYMES